MNLELEESAAGRKGLPFPSGRIRERFPVSVVYQNGGMLKSSVKGWAEYYDRDGLCVRLEKSLPKETKVSVDFRAPDSLCPLWSGIRCKFPADVFALRRAGSAPGYELLMRWRKPLPKLVDAALLSHHLKMATLVAFSVAWMVWLRWTTFTFFWYDPFVYFYTISIGLFYLTRFFLTWAHRPPDLAGYAPSVSIVISVRNEVDGIAQTVRSCYAAEYPDDKREVIVVDDGSTDGTGKALEELQKKIPRLKCFSIPPSGKRFGMARGIREATGELLVFVDSDTLLDRMALKRLVCGFEDPTLGAVSGYTAVGNADKNFLTRMQDVRYTLSYELMKAPESLFSCVTCCPGCLSAYRRTYVMEILDPWLNQMFLGARATFGDDRSLTNFIMRRYRVTYNPMAICTTLVPDNIRQYMRQQVRWKKSWLRETLIAGSFMYRKHPIAALSFYVSAMCSVVSPFMVFRAFWWAYFDDSAILAGYLLGLLLLGVSMAIFVQWKRPNRNWYCVWFLVASQVLIMGPQTYYAMLTMRKTHWGTR